MSSAKFVVLQKLRAERDILFGERGSTTGITKGMKVKKWTEVADLAQSVGLLKNKPWQYMRNTIWPNWRKRTLAKTSRGAATSELDELVLEILERPEPDSGVESSHHLDSLLGDNADDTVYATPLERKSKRNHLHYTPIDAESRKKIRTDLQIENLKIKGYKMKLEALELEMKLGLPRSEHTRDLPQLNGPDDNHDDAYKTER